MSALVHIVSWSRCARTGRVLACVALKGDPGHMARRESYRRELIEALAAAGICEERLPCDRRQGPCPPTCGKQSGHDGECVDAFTPLAQGDM